MTKQDWIRKLTSRKFWAAIAGFVTGLVAFISAPSGSSEAITGLIMSLGTLVAYIVGEGLIDAAGAQTQVVYVPTQELSTAPVIEKPPAETAEGEETNG